MSSKKSIFLKLNIYTLTNELHDEAIRKAELDKKKESAKTQIGGYSRINLAEYNQKIEEAETTDSAFLALKLNFFMGLRIAELVSLKWCDIEEDSVHVVREEIRNQMTNEVSVEEHTKTHTDRHVIIVPKAKEILQELRKRFGETEYIFTRNGAHVTARQVAYILEKYAERKNIPVKSTHKIRKTYASNLSNSRKP